MAKSEDVNAIYTCGFAGFESDSLWFPPFEGVGRKVDEPMLENMRLARETVRCMLEVGCSQAALARPDLAQELSALSKPEFDISFFDFPAVAPAIGWFRLVASVPGATPEALAACEKALSESRAPLLAAKAEGALALFGRGESDEPPASLVGSAVGATGSVAEAYGAIPKDLGSAEVARLTSAAGATVSFAYAAPEGASNGLADFKSFAKLAQAAIEARAECEKAGIPGSELFFKKLTGSLGASADGALAKRVSVGLPKGIFFHAPSKLVAMDFPGLPAEGFEPCARAFANALAKRFGPVAASGSAFAGIEDFEGLALSATQLAKLGGLFSKLAPRQKVQSALVDSKSDKQNGPNP